VASYISHHHRGGWRYVYHIPVALRPMFQGRTAFRRYMKRCPRRQAELQAMRWALEDAERLEACRRVPVEEREGFAALGGMEAILANPDIPTSQLDPRYDAMPDKDLYWKRMQAEAALKQTKTTSAPLDASWDALLARWLKQSGARQPRNHEHTIKLLKEMFPEADCRKITYRDIAKFRDSLTAQGKSRGTITGHLGRLHAIYKAARKEPVDNPFHDILNPVAEVSVSGKAEPRKDGADRVFTPPEVLSIFDTAARVRFGDQRHEKIMWALRLIAYGGFRPKEIFQLQGADLALSYNGVKFIWVRHTDAVSGRPHPQKSVKNDKPRMVPLHPELAGFYEFAQKFDKDAFIYGDIEWKKINARAWWIFDNFSHLLHDDCKINDPNRRLSFYSFRHAFKTQMRIQGVPKDISDRICGHGKDISDSYGGGAEELPMLLECVARVSYQGGKPLIAQLGTLPR
jgi:integrase